MRNHSEDAPDCRPARLPSTKIGSRVEKKRQSLLTLHARGYSVESNSQGYRCICIPLEEEDKLNQHLTSTKRLLDPGEQNESFLIWAAQVWGRLLSERYNLHGVLVCTTEQFMVNILFFPSISASLDLPNAVGHCLWPLTPSLPESRSLDAFGK